MLHTTSPVPWFRQRPQLTWAVAGVLFAAVFAARMVDGGPVDATALLFSLPIALVAVAFGSRAGLGAGLVGVVLLLAWAVTAEVAMPALAWTARTVPMLLLGGLLGHASDRLMATERENIRLADAARRHRDAVELHDAVTQRLAAAKWALEAGRTDAALELIQETLEYANEMISGLLRDAGAGRTVDVALPAPDGAPASAQL